MVVSSHVRPAGQEDPDVGQPATVPESAMSGGSATARRFVESIDDVVSTPAVVLRCAALQAQWVRLLLSLRCHTPVLSHPTLGTRRAKECR